MKSTVVKLSAAMALCLFTGCANAQPPSEPEATMPVTTELCTSPDSLTANLKIRRTAADDGMGDLRLSSAPKIGKLTVYNEIYLSGKCASRLTGYSLGMYYFGRIAVETGTGEKLVSVSAPPRFYLADRSIPASGPHPVGITGTFLGAIPVDSRTGSVTFVGIWQIGAGSTAYIFTRRDSGSFEEVAELISSPSGIRSVSYTPSPDSRSGGLAVVQDHEGGSKITNLSWDQ